MRCGLYFARYILCLFNFVIFLVGAGILAVGVWVNIDKDSFLHFTAGVDPNTLPQLQELTRPEVVAQISYILIAAGGFVFILSLLGYCGALRESRCLLGFYGVLLVLILILEITAAGLAFVYKDRAETETKAFLKDTIQDYYTTDTDKNNPATVMWNLLMSEMSCCGVDNYTDFNNSEKFREKNLKVPIPCCKVNETSTSRSLLDPDCPKNPKVENSYYLTGCYKTLMDRIMDHMNIVIYVVVAIVLIELLATFLAFCLYKLVEPNDK